MVWTLAAKAYGFRERIAAAIEQILETAQLDIESSNDVAAAVREYRSESADFADCLLVRVNAAAGCVPHRHLRSQGGEAGGLRIPEKRVEGVFAETPSPGRT